MGKSYNYSRLLFPFYLATVVGKSSSSDTKGVTNSCIQLTAFFSFSCEGKDSGFDNKRLLSFVRDTLGAECIISAKIGRPSKSIPRGAQRKRLKSHFPKSLCHRR
jgi:hypothetical protein